MDDRTSEASSYDPLIFKRPDRELQQGPTRWEQLALLPSGHIVVKPQIIIDGPASSMTASITVTDFWSEDDLAIEVISSATFPRDLAVVLLWLEERIQHYAARVSPF